MSLDSSQIVHSLIAFYKRRGADLTYMLGDPLFDKLPIEDKVNAIKTHASTILASTPAGFNRDEKKLIAGEVIAGGLTTGLAAYGLGRTVFGNPAFANTFARNRAMAAAGGVAVVGGLLGGAMIGRLKADSLEQKRLAIRNELARTVNHPSAENAIGVLAATPLHHHMSAGRANIISKIINKIDDLALKPVVDRTEEHFNKQYRYFEDKSKEL